MTEFKIIDRVKQSDGTQVLTIQQSNPPISGHWTAIVSTDGISDRMIAPSGKFLQFGTVPSSIPHELWGFLADVV